MALNDDLFGFGGLFSVQAKQEQKSYQISPTYAPTTTYAPQTTKQYTEAWQYTYAPTISIASSGVTGASTKKEDSISTTATPTVSVIPTISPTSTQSQEMGGGDGLGAILGSSSTLLVIGGLALVGLYFLR